MIYGNLPNPMNNFSLLGRVSKEVELKVRAPFLTYGYRLGKYWFGGYSLLYGQGWKCGDKRKMVPTALLRDKRYCSVLGLRVFFLKYCFPTLVYEDRTVLY